MSLWLWILIACVLAYLTKLVGYFVPAKLLESPRIMHVAGTMTIGLLASLTVVNAVASGQGLVLDAASAPWRPPPSLCGSGHRSWWW